MASLHDEILRACAMRPFQPDVIDVASIPREMIERTQWLIWRWGEAQPSGRRPKVPCAPRTCRPADHTDPTMWGSFTEARDAYMRCERDTGVGGVGGIGFVFTLDDPFAFLDLDHVRDPTTGAITPEALELVTRFDTYTEISPSGTGLHSVFRLEPGHLIAPTRLAASIEVYSARQFMTVTGQRLLCGSAAIEARGEVFTPWFEATRATRTTRATTAQSAARSTAATQTAPRSLPSATIRRSRPLSDGEIRQKARRARDGTTFAQLWEGEWRRLHYPSQSEADLALIRRLACYTQDPEQLDRLFRQSELFRPKWDERHKVSPSGPMTYGQMTIQTALTTRKRTYRAGPSAQSARSRDQRVIHTYAWQRVEETPEARIALLRRLAEQAKGRVQAHLDARDTTPLASALAPGVGKTFTMAELGAPYNLGWLAPRHDLYDEIVKRAPFAHMLPCGHTNCPDADRLNRLAALGHTVWPMHQRHGCAYSQQFQGSGSAFYVDLLASAAHLSRHRDGIIVDELDVASWLPEETITLAEMGRAALDARWQQPGYEVVAQLLRVAHDTMAAAQWQAEPRATKALTAKALYDLLDRAAGGRLAAWVRQIAELEVVQDPRPRVSSDEEARMAAQRGKVILPRLARVLLEDLPKWETGGDWNSRMRLELPTRGEETLRIIEPRRFHDTLHAVPRVILDATADATILALLLGMPVQVERQTVDPPPHTRHIAARTTTARGRHKRYSQFSLVDAKHAARERERVVRELSAILAEVNPDGQRSVGLITYAGCEQALGEALGIPPERRSHFWGMRGTNDLEDCEILIVVGTPTINIAEMEWKARALYAADPVPLETTSTNGRYADARLAQLADHLINAELTQAAHRNRPLRYDHRVVITLTNGRVDALPITEEITAFGDLPTATRLRRRAQTAQDQEMRLEQAYQALVARGEQITGERLAKEASVRKTAALAWWRRHTEAQDIA